MWLVAFSPAAWATPSVIELPQSGRNQTDVEIRAFGRIAVEVESTEGASLQLVDRMAGPGATRGTVGGEDGRHDLFVDVGQIRVVTRGPNGAEGNLRVLVTPFERLGSSPQLHHRARALTDLRDKTERSWWIDHESTSQPLHFEAIGRHVGDLRLWRDGTWLVDTRPACTTLEPVVGQPLQHCTLTTSPEPGLYQLVAYGGPGTPWAEDAPDDTLEVRWDLPVRAGNGRLTGRIGATGRAAFLVDRDIDTAHVALEEHAAVELHFQSTTGSPFALGAAEASISDTSRVPTATAYSSSNKPKIVAVEGAPGQRYTLSWFDQTNDTTLPAGREALLTSLSSARWQDHFPPTAVVSYRDKDHDVLVDEVAVQVPRGRVFRKRFNLLDTTHFLLRVDTESTHLLAFTEGKGSFRVEPYFTQVPKGYERPNPRANQWQESLRPGLYLVEMNPMEPGVATVEVTRNDWSDVAQRSVSSNREISLPPELRTSFVARGTKAHRIQRFGQDGQASGLSLSPYPLDLSRTHALSLRANETWVAKVTTDTPVLIRATRPDGEPIDLELPGQRGPQLDVPRGSWSLSLHNTGDPVVVSLAPVVPPDEPTPLPADRLGKLPNFPKLTAGKPHTTDLGREQTETLELNVPADGLYHLQSTGLLATRGSLRSRVVFGLGTGEANGVGRNFRVARYLRSGAYQVTVGTRGKSQGHLGVELAQVPMQDGGQLLPDETARITLPAESGVAYRFHLDARTPVTVSSTSPQGTFPCRLEDEDGWPIVPPTESCRLDVTLDPGDYVVRSLPTDVLSKRTTQIRTRPLPEPLTGYGPFTLVPGRPLAKDWVEPVGDGERPFDRYTLVLPADDKVELTLSSEMTGSIERDETAVARLVPGRPWQGRLDAGTYTVLVQGVRRGTGIPYTLRATTEALLVGQRRSVRSPTELPIRIGSAGLVTMRSDGMADVRARLTTADGTLVAANDDRPDGWDFQIATWLQPGDYTLAVEHVGGERNTSVVLEAPVDEPGAELKLNGKPVQLDVSSTPTVHTVSLGDSKKLLAVSASSDQNLGLALEARMDGRWQNLGHASGRDLDLLARRAPATEVRVRLWSVDGRSGTATLNVSVPPTRKPSEASLLAGVSFDSVGALPTRGLRPGIFRVLGDRSNTRVCRAEGAPCVPIGTVVSLDDDTVLTGMTLRLERADLRDSVPLELSATPSALGTGMSGRVAVTVRTGDTLPNLHMAGDHAAAAGRGSTLAVGSGQMNLWGQGGARLVAVPLEIERRSWAADRELRLTLAPRSAVELPLDKVARTYPIALQRGVFARVGDGAVWADDDSVQARLVGADKLFVANPTSEERFVTLSAPLVDAVELVPDASSEWFAVAPGSLVLPVAADSGTLRAHNAELVFRSPDGTLQVGDGLDASAGGVVEVRHGTGWTAVWSEATRPGPQKTVTRSVPLDEPGLHRLTADGPFAAEVTSGSRRRVVLRPLGGSVDVLVSAESSMVGIRPLGDQPDVKLTHRLTAVPTLIEGLGEPVLLEGGQDAWFRFDVSTAGPVGVGARAAADRVETRIVSADGRTVASGVVAMADLTPGEWYLVLSQPTDAPPVAVRPAIAGLDRPDTGPPDDVVRTYLNRAGLKTDGGAQ